MSTSSVRSAGIPTATDAAGQLLSMRASRSQAIARSPHSMREELIAAQARSVSFGLRPDAVALVTPLVTFTGVAVSTYELLPPELWHHIAQFATDHA